MWKEVVVAYYPGLYQGLRKSIKKTGYPAQDLIP
jgi:hypothetical protein